MCVQLESSRKLSEVKSLHDKIRVSSEEMKKKEETHKQLVQLHLGDSHAFRSNVPRTPVTPGGFSWS